MTVDETSATPAAAITEAPRAPRVLCYAPYNRWALHGQWEMTILHALRLRGADVSYVLCDGLYTDCDVFWQATDPRPSNACVRCRREVTGLVERLGMDHSWLGRHLRDEERREAQRWSAALGTADLLRARYGEWDVAAWVTGSIHSHFRSSSLDVGDPRVEAAVRSYLFSGLVACFALERLLDDARPDVLLVFNGRQSSTRVALELARRRGIRVVCHERGPRSETLALAENTHCVDLEPFRRYWREWKDVPLSERELEEVATHLHEREHGVGLSWKAFTAAPQHPDTVRAALGLDPARPTWVLFTSSDDEVVAERDWQGDFATQLEWIERTIAHARRNPGIDLVVRAHPNTGSARSTGANHRQLEQFERLAHDLPANVRMIAPEQEVSSYSLMEIATVGLVYHSTAGLELACKGRATVVAAGSMVTGLPFVHTVADARRYEALLDELSRVPAGAYFPDVARRAFRFAHGRFFRMCVPFPLVKMSSPALGARQWSDPAELVPGRDAGLDRCVRVVLDGERVCPPPTPAQAAHDDAAEREWFGDADANRFTALAFATELIEDASLLAAWAANFPGAAGATLVIQTPAAATEELLEAVRRAGLDDETGPDLVAVDAPVAELGDLHALFSRVPSPECALPRFDDESTEALRSFAGAAGSR